MPDYQQAKIYKLWSPSKNLIYYGSTTQTLAHRLSSHLKDYKRYNKGCYHYVTSFKILEFEDYKIELVEDYPCNNRQQLCKKEGEHIKANECVNKRIDGRTPKEYRDNNIDKAKQYRENNRQQQKQYRENNKDKIKENAKKYRDANADKIKQYNREYRAAQKLKQELKVSLIK
jgi:hypothetical protein